MDKEQCFEFGRLGKPVGHQGGIRLHHETDDISVYEGVKWVLLDLRGGLVPFEVKSFRLRSDDNAYLELKGIDSEEKAKELQGIQVFLPLEILPKLSGKKFYFHEVIGWSAFDEEKGDIGTIKDVLESGHQHVFSIDCGGREILIPIHDDFIESVNRETRQIRFRTPEGLIDIYLNPGADESDDEEENLKDLWSNKE